MKRVACAVAALVFGWGCGVVYHVLRSMLFSGFGRVTDGAAIAFWTALYAIPGGLIVLAPIALFADHRRRWLSPVWFPTVGAVCAIAVFCAFVGWWTGWWHNPGFLMHAAVVGFFCGLLYSLLARDTAAERGMARRRWLPGVVTCAVIAGVTIAQPIVRERERRLEPRIWTFRHVPGEQGITINALHPESALTDDELALVLETPVRGTLVARVSREPLVMHPSQVVLVLREPPAQQIELPAPKRGTIVVWQTETGELDYSPRDLRLHEQGRWSVKPDRGNAMVCRDRGQCWLVWPFSTAP